MTDYDPDNLPPEWEEPLEFAEAVRALAEPQRAYISAMMDWLKADDSGEILELLTAHRRRGERVSDTYFDMESRQVRTLPQGKSVPERWVPILGPLALPQ